MGQPSPSKKTHRHTETQLKLRSPLSTENQIPPHWNVKPPSKKRFQENYPSQKREKGDGNSTKRLFFCIQNFSKEKEAIYAMCYLWIYDMCYDMCY